MERIAIKPTHEAADAFWTYWRENGETHKHGYYESTWGAINAALRVAGVVTRESAERQARELQTRVAELEDENLMFKNEVADLRACLKFHTDHAKQTLGIPIK